MGVFSEFNYGEGVVYGDTALATRAVVLSANLIALYFDEEVLVNAAYLSPANYPITVDEGAGEDIAVLAVLPVNDPATDRVYLRTSYHTGGTTYAVNPTGLLTRSGGPIVGDFRFVSRRTKLDSIYANIPSHFSSDSESLIKNILLAIAQSDDTIGGSRNDTLP